MDKNKLLKRLDDVGQQVLVFFNQLDETAWIVQVYTEGEAWTVHQILAHFVSVERAFQWLIDDIVSGGAGTPKDFDLDRFNHEQVRSLQTQSRKQLLDTFQSERRATLKLVSHFDPDDYLKEGNHPWFGRLSITAILKLLYRHNKLHIRDIRRTLAGHGSAAS